MQENGNLTLKELHIQFGIAKKTEFVTDDSGCQLSEVGNNMANMSQKGRFCYLERFDCCFGYLICLSIDGY
jgi:hypothetical protein